MSSIIFVSILIAATLFPTVVYFQNCEIVMQLQNSLSTDEV